jgi:hypothetical protein
MFSYLYYVIIIQITKQDRNLTDKTTPFTSLCVLQVFGAYKNKIQSFLAIEKFHIQVLPSLKDRILVTYQISVRIKTNMEAEF